MKLFKYKYLILGAGPSGLSFARRLQQLGEDSFLVLEKEQEAGGLCQSVEISGSFIDIGGGHFLDAYNQKVLDFLFEHLPVQNWNRYSRISQIELDGNVIDYPIESNLWQLPGDKQIEYLESVARAGCISGIPEPKRFSDWIRWKLGDLIAETYLLPYNEKLWSCNIDELGTYWVHKLPNVSLRQILQSCLERKSVGNIPAHGDFFYPKQGGYGAVWKSIAEQLSDKIVYGEEVNNIESHVVNGTYVGDTIINTIPWSIWPDICDMPNRIEFHCRQLKWVSIDVEFINKDYHSEAHWVYCPDKILSYHRVLVMNNFSCNRPAYWTESNSKRAVHNQGNYFHRNEFAYPIPLGDKPKHIQAILAWAKSQRIVGLGRWGEWSFFNSDICVQRALSLAESFCKKCKEAY